MWDIVTNALARGHHKDHKKSEADNSVLMKLAGDSTNTNDSKSSPIESEKYLSYVCNVHTAQQQMDDTDYTSDTEQYH